MTITLYHTDSDPKVLTKVLTDASSTLTAAVRDAVDIRNPVLRIQQSILLDAYNYLYIKEFDRYYWFTVVIDRTGLSDLHCKCDVLMSHDAEIRKSPAVLSRSANAVTPYVSDSLAPVASLPANSVKNFFRPLDPAAFEFTYGTDPLKNLILVTMG